MYMITNINKNLLNIVDTFVKNIDIMTQFLLITLPLIPLLLAGFAIVSKTTKTLLVAGTMALALGATLAILSLFNVHLGAEQSGSLSNSTIFSFLFRLDSLSATMMLMVSIIGFVVVRFSKNYLAGDSRQSNFYQRLFLTIALVQLFVLSGNLISLLLSWVATSFSLQSLIAFYKERKGAVAAVKKKFVVARISDFTFFLGLLFLFLQYQSFSLHTIFNEMKDLSLETNTLYLKLSAVFIATAAIIKSVQVPFHGWILEVMEAPTPVSALLHAGLLNAGPFLIIRFSFLFEATTIGSVMLLIVGGVSALYGTIVYPSQASVKTALAYSSIGHMGFSLMLCGLGLYSAALLHLVAHSFYKAHAFLSSGSNVDRKRLQLLNGTLKNKASFWNLLLGLAFSGVIFMGLNTVFGSSAHQQFQFQILQAIIVLGVSTFLSSTAAVFNLSQLLKGIALTGLVLFSFLLFESLISNLISSEIPNLNEPHVWMQVASVVLVVLYTLVAMASKLQLAKSNLIQTKWEVFRRNGFYVHQYFDRLVQLISPSTTKL